MKLKLFTTCGVPAALVGRLNDKSGATFLRYIQASALGEGS